MLFYENKRPHYYVGKPLTITLKILMKYSFILISQNSLINNLFVIKLEDGYLIMYYKFITSLLAIKSDSVQERCNLGSIQKIYLLDLVQRVSNTNAHRVQTESVQARNGLDVRKQEIVDSLRSTYSLKQFFSYEKSNPLLIELPTSPRTIVTKACI